SLSDGFLAERGHTFLMIAERGNWSLSELVAGGSQGSPVTLFLSALLSLELAERAN
ncbi:hypothetical protein A2U01_0112732, partial [Trifolium medium]|nr:hypothetical protein [Trifolium medium]